jgi:hypothetical protein
MGSPAAVAPFVGRLRALPGHVFWKDDLSQLATFDRRLPTKAVRRGRAALHVIDGDG